MGKIVVAKLYRLGKDGDKFKKEYKTALRERVIIDADFVKQFNAQTMTSGQMYEIDEKATAERDAIVAGKKEKPVTDNDPQKEMLTFLEGLELEELKQYACDLGVTEEEIGNKKSKGIINLILEKQ